MFSDNYNSTILENLVRLLTKHAFDDIRIEYDFIVLSGDVLISMMFVLGNVFNCHLSSRKQYFMLKYNNKCYDLRFESLKSVKYSIWLVGL